MENVTINLVTNGNNQAELIIRNGDAEKLIDPKPPVQSNLKGSIKTVTEYLSKRINTGQINQQRAHIIVNRDDLSLTLVINENDDFIRDTIYGKLILSDKISEFGINDGKIWEPFKLGMFLKMNRVFFPDKNEAMSLISNLINFTANINCQVERRIKESGSNIDNFSQIVNSNLPNTFSISLPIFKSMPNETIEVETFAKVDGRTVNFILLSPGLEDYINKIRDSIIDEQLTIVRNLAPDIVIVEQ